MVLSVEVPVIVRGPVTPVIVLPGVTLLMDCFTGDNGLSARRTSETIEEAMIDVARLSPPVAKVIADSSLAALQAEATSLFTARLMSAAELAPAKSLAKRRASARTIALVADPPVDELAKA